MITSSPATSGVLGLVLLSQLLCPTQGYCYLLLPEKDMTDFTPNKGLVLEEGGHISQGCLWCMCEEDMLFCSGTESFLGLMEPPEGCSIEPDGACKYKVVSKENSSLPCPVPVRYMSTYLD